MIFSGRIIHGIGEGMIQVITIIYLSEYIKEKYRGGALSSTTIGCLLGMVVTYICGVTIPWRVSAGIFTAMNLLSLLGSFVIQESPLWLSLKENTKQDEGEDDLENTKKVQMDPTLDEDHRDISQRVKQDWSLTRIISTSLAPFLLFLAPITGCFSIAFFAISMVEKMHMGNPACVAIGVGLMRVVGAACGGAFVQKFGRRISLIFSSASTSISLVMVSVLLMLDTLPPAVFNYGMIALLVLVMFCTSLGMAPVPWIILGEWPHVRDKGIVGTVGASLFYISIFLASMLPGILEPALGMAGMFAVFAAITGILLVLAVLLVPETSGKSYPEFIAEQTIKKTFSLWLPDLKINSDAARESFWKKLNIPSNLLSMCLPKKENELFYQVLAVLVSFAGNLSMGLGFGFVSPYGKQIDDDLGMNEDLNDLLIGDVSFGGLLGCIIAGKLADKIGRKRGLTVSFTFTTFGWLVVTFSMNTAMIFSGRIIHGIGEGMIQVITIIYLSEYIKEKYRGGALSSTTIGCLLGMVVTYICGVTIPWRVSAGIFTIMNLLSLFGSFVIQESPLWSRMKENVKHNEEADVENTESIKMDSELDDNQNDVSKNEKKDISLTRIISTSLAPFLLFLAPITGCFSIAFFAISMVEKMHMGNPACVAIGVGLMRVVGAACGGAFVQKFGRRISLIFSSATTSISLVMVSV